MKERVGMEKKGLEKCPIKL